MERLDRNETVNLPGFSDLKFIRADVVRDVFSNMPLLPAKRVGNEWVEFSLTAKRPEHPHEAHMKQEPTLGQLGITEFGDSIDILAAKPSELAAHLPLEERRRMPLQYIRKLYSLKIINDVIPSLTYPEGEEAAAVSSYINTIMFGDKMYRIIPTTIAGYHANGAATPKLDVYEADVPLAEIVAATPLLTFYNSPTAVDHSDEVLHVFS